MRLSTQSTLICMFLISAVIVSAEHTRLEWSDCGTDPAIRIHHLSVSPMPVLVPGNISFSLNVTNGGLQIDRMVLHLSSRRKYSWFDLPMPCIFNIGSCTYDNTCTLLRSMQDENWAGVMAGIGAQLQEMLASAGITDYCPIVQRDIRINNYVLAMPPVPSILAFFAEGDYETGLRAVDYASNRLLICLNLKTTMKLEDKRCDDWFCRMKRVFQIQ